MINDLKQSYPISKHLHSHFSTVYMRHPVKKQNLDVSNETIYKSEQKWHSDQETGNNNFISLPYTKWNPFPHK